MLRALIVASVAVGFLGCGGGTEEADELRKYVDSLKGFEEMNRQVSDHITLLDSPSIDVTAADLQKGRDLVDNYIAELAKLDGEFVSTELRRAFQNYYRKVQQAKELGADSGRDIKRERGNVAIALRHIEKYTKSHYAAGVDLLWGRMKIEGEMPLKWPAQS